VVAVGLRQERVGGPRQVGVPARGEDRDACRDRITAQPPDELDAIYDRHHDVGHHQIRDLFLRCLQASGAILRDGHVMPLLPQCPSDQEPLVRLVIDHENPGHPGPAPSGMLL
jgi:hypothetical protein